MGVNTKYRLVGSSNNLYFEVNLIAILLGDLNLHAKFFCHSIQ